MADTYDVIVLGVGGMGSAACFELARRGRRVLGLEQFSLAHARGSSHGHTRIIRTAYYEHPDYVPLLRRAWALWRGLERRAGRRLLTPCPCLNVGPAGGDLVAGVRASAARHGLPVEPLTARDIAERFPFRFDDSDEGVLEQEAGVLYAEECVRAHVDAAAGLGADLRPGEPARAWAAAPGGVTVTTDRGTYHAGSLVVTAGAWAAAVLAGLRVPLAVMRQVMLWFDAAGREAAFGPAAFPVFIADVPGGPFYGVPAAGGRGLKAARHYGAPALAGPAGVDWTPRPDDELPVRAFLDRYIPGFTGGLTRSEVCMYTLTPDRHFVLDVHPDHPRVVVAAGFSGHGFKFAPAVGEVLADLAESARTDHPIGLFRATRFAAGAG